MSSSFFLKKLPLAKTKILRKCLKIVEIVKVIQMANLKIIDTFKYLQMITAYFLFSYRGFFVKSIYVLACR